MITNIEQGKTLERAFPTGMGFLVVVTSKNTGKSTMQWCRNEADAEVFIDYVSDKIDENGEVWWSTHAMHRIRVFDRTKTI